MGAHYAMLSEHHPKQKKENLRVLALYLLEHGKTIYKKNLFTMTCFSLGSDEISEKTPLEVFNECGTVGCAAGYGPVAGIEPKYGQHWMDYVNENFCQTGQEVYNWIFSGTWGYVDNTPYGAALRIQDFLDNPEHIPDGFDMWDFHDGTKIYPHKEAVENWIEEMGNN